MNRGFQSYLQAWFKTKPGKRVFVQEQSLLNKLLVNKFGYYLVQLGCVSSQSLTRENRISNKVLIDSQVCENQALIDEHFKLVLSDFDFLPIKTETVDLVLLPHTLESVDDPYYLLRQVDSMLLAEGHLVITGFNPAGCIPVKYKFLRRNRDFAKAKHHRASKVKEWLHVLGYEVEKVQCTPVMCFSASEKYKLWARVIEKLERGLQWLGFEFGNVYCVVAKKKVDAPTMVGLKWHLPRWKKVSGAVTSSRFKSHRNQND